MAIRTEAGAPEAPGPQPPGVLLDLKGINYTAVPNEVLDHWQTEAFPVTLRVMACIVRNSFGYHTACCMRHQEKQKPRPMQQVDLAEILKLSKSQVSKAIHELTAQRLVWFTGRLLYAVANPGEFPAPAPTRAREAEAQEKDPEYHQEIEEARAEYQAALNQARAHLQQRLKLAELHYQSRQAGAAGPEVAEPGNLARVAGIDNSELPELTTKVAGNATRIIIEVKKVYKGERKQAREELRGNSTREPREASPACPLPSSKNQKLEKAFEYLNQFTPQIGKSPPQQLVAEFVERLKGASLEQVETVRQQRVSAGLVFHSYGIFLEFADDCATSKEAFESGKKPVTREQRQAEDYARRRHAERQQH